MKKLLQTEMFYKTRSLLLACCILLATSQVIGQQATVLPSNGSHSGKSGPQGSLRYQRMFFLITPEELKNAGLTTGMNFHSIGFIISRAQNDTTQGNLKLYLQNTTDLVSRADTTWDSVIVNSNSYHATGLFPGKYEWQVQANCTAKSPFTSSVNFTNDELGGCNIPYNLEATGITTNAATLSWEAAASTGFVQYKLEYTSVDVINWVELTTTDTFYNLTGLSPSTSYQWRVRTDCGTDSSAINSSSFTTADDSYCDLPSGLSTNVSQDSMVTLSWIDSTDAFYYEVQFRRLGTLSWSTASSFSKTVNLILPIGTTYQWQVRAICIPGPSSSYVAGSNFTTGGTPVCYEPTNPITRLITPNSANLTWTAVPGASSYIVRYRLKNTITWDDAISPMTKVRDSIFSIPDTTGAYDIPFTYGTSFAYTGEGIYVAMEYSRPTGLLSTPNLTLSTTAGTSIKGAGGQDSLRFLLSMASRGDTSLVALPAILGETEYRPETRFGSNDLKDSVEVVSVYTLGMTVPRFQSPTVVSATVANKSTSDKNYDVTLTIKDQLSGTTRYTVTQNVAVTATDTVLVVFNGWMPEIMETDSVFVSVPAEAGENVIGNNRKAYLQQVNQNILAYDNGTPVIAEAGFGTTEGLILARYNIQGCGKVIGAQVYLSESASGNPLKAVVRNTAGAIVAESALFTPGQPDVNKYHSFYFTSPPSFLNEDFYIGIAQPASVNYYKPVGVQWEDAEPRQGAYYTADTDGSNLLDYPQQGRLMIKAEVVSSALETFISGSNILCTNATNTLTAGSASVRYANSVVAYSSQNVNASYSASQVLGSPNVYPLYTLSPGAWVSSSPDDQREYLELGFPGAAPVNYIDIYETANGGAVDSVFVKNPGTSNYELVYSATAAPSAEVARKLRINFTATLFDVTEVRIAINSPAVPGYNAIDAVAIGETTVPGAFSTYLWWPGGETTATKQVNSPGTYKLTVTNGNGCSSTDSMVVVASATTTPVITASNSGTICQGDSVVLTSSQASSITWSNNATTPSIVVYTAGNYTVSYDNGAGCGLLTSAPFAVVVNALPIPVITGSTDICVGNETTLDAGSGFASYLWSTGEMTQTVSVGDAGKYTVKVTDANGCSDTTSVTTSFITLAEPVITGDLSFCPGGSTTLDAGAGYASYLWSTGATTQTANITTAGTISVTVTNASGCSAYSSVQTSIYQPPVPQINGNLGFCTGGSTTLTVSPAYDGYLWSTNATTQSINVGTTGLFSVTVTDANGCTGSTSVTTVNYPSPSPVISGTLSFCGGSGTTLNAGSGYSSYLWNTSATTQSIVVTTVGSYSVEVTNSYGCTGSTSVNTTNTGSIPATPGPITGADVAVCTSSHSYSIDPVTNSSHYVWTVPTGASIASGQGTTAITVNFGSMFKGGNIIVAASNACGQSPSLTARKLFVKALPDKPGPITGVNYAICGKGELTYSIAAVPLATSYTWEVPFGATLKGGQGTLSIQVTFATGFTNGYITVKANNACGSGLESKLMVSGVPATPGVITGADTVCANIPDNYYSITPIPGATSYTWTVPKNATIQSGQGTATIRVKFGPASGNITVLAINSCGKSSVSIKPITSLYCGTRDYVVGQIKPVPEVISSHGGYHNAGETNIEWTIGEPRVDAVATNGILYTQGFHQPVIIISQKEPVAIDANDITITVYPNPVGRILKVKIESTTDQKLTLELNDFFSRKLHSQDVNTGNHVIAELQMSRYIPGTYFLVVRDAKGKIIRTIKLLKLE